MSESPLKDKLRLETFTNANLLPIFAIIVIFSIIAFVATILKKYFTRQNEQVLQENGALTGGTIEAQSVKSAPEVVTGADFQFTAPEEIPEGTQ